MEPSCTATLNTGMEMQRETTLVLSRGTGSKIYTWGAVGRTILVLRMRFPMSNSATSAQPAPESPSPARPEGCTSHLVMTASSQAEILIVVTSIEFYQPCRPQHGAGVNSKPCRLPFNFPYACQARW